MIQPDAIVRQVWQGMVPADWQVIHGKRASAFVAGCFATFFSLILLIVLSVFAVVLMGFAHFGSEAPSEQLSPDFFNPAGSSTIAGLPALEALGGAALAIALLVGIITGLLVGRDRGDPDPVLVLLPNGFVEYVSHRKPIISISFPELRDVNVRVHTTASTSTNPTTGMSTTSTSTRIWLDLLYRNGRTERWQPRANFGRRLDVCQAIVKAHSRYEALYGRGQ